MKKLLVLSLFLLLLAAPATAQERTLRLAEGKDPQSSCKFWGPYKIGSFGFNSLNGLYYFILIDAPWDIIKITPGANLNANATTSILRNACITGLDISLCVNIEDNVSIFAVIIDGPTSTE